MHPSVDMILGPQGQMSSHMVKNGWSWIALSNCCCSAPKTSCRRAAATICPRPSPPQWAPKRLAPPSRRQRSSSFPRPTRSHAHTAMSKAAWWSWPLTFWPWKWCLSHVWRGLPFGLPRPLCSQLRPDVRDRRQTDRRQTASSLYAPVY